MNLHPYDVHRACHNLHAVLACGLCEFKTGNQQEREVK